MKTKYVPLFVQFSAGIIFLSLLLFQCTASKESSNLDEDAIRNMVNNKEFIFVADRVVPLRGRSRHLTSQYDVSVQKDSLVSYLPFFGRAYQAPANLSGGGIQFTSTNFSYEVHPGKKNSWIVIIQPHDDREVQELSFTILSNGSATCNVTSTNRDPISFYGRIQKGK